MKQGIYNKYNLLRQLLPYCAIVQTNRLMLQDRNYRTMYSGKFGTMSRTMDEKDLSPLSITKAMMINDTLNNSFKSSSTYLYDDSNNPLRGTVEQLTTYRNRLQALTLPAFGALLVMHYPHPKNYTGYGQPVKSPGYQRTRTFINALLPRKVSLFTNYIEILNRDYEPLYTGPIGKITSGNTDRISNLTTAQVVKIRAALQCPGKPDGYLYTDDEDNDPDAYARNWAPYFNRLMALKYLVTPDNAVHPYIEAPK